MRLSNDDDSTCSAISPRSIAVQYAAATLISVLQPKVQFPFSKVYRPYAKLLPSVGGFPKLPISRHVGGLCPNRIAVAAISSCLYLL